MGQSRLFTPPATNGRAGIAIQTHDKQIHDTQTVTRGREIVNSRDRPAFKRGGCPVGVRSFTNFCNRATAERLFEKRVARATRPCAAATCPERPGGLVARWNRPMTCSPPAPGFPTGSEPKQCGRSAAVSAARLVRMPVGRASFVAAMIH